MPVSHKLLSGPLGAFPSVDEHCCHHLTSLQHNSSENQLVNTCLDMDLGFKIPRTASQLSSPVPPSVTSIQVIHLSPCKPAKLHLQTAKPFAPTQPLYRLLQKSAGQYLPLVCRHSQFMPLCSRIKSIYI